MHLRGRVVAESLSHLTEIPMRRFIASVAAIVMVAGLVATVRAQAKAEDKTVEGELVDMWCFSKGGASGDGHAAFRADSSVITTRRDIHS